MIPDPAVRPWLTTHELAELTGESVDAWWRAAREGTAPVAPIRLGRRQLRWPTAPLLRALGLLDPAHGEAPAHQPALAVTDPGEATSSDRHHRT